MTTINPGNMPEQPIDMSVEHSHVTSTFYAGADAEYVDIMNEDFTDGGLTDSFLVQGQSAELPGDELVLSTSTGIAPEEVSFKNFPERIGNTFQTFGREISEKGYRGKRIGAFLLAGTAQVLDRARVMIFVLPTVFDEVLEHGIEQDWNGYQTAGTAAVAVGGMFAAWGWAVGKSFHTSLNQYPATTDRVVENHPAMVGAISNAITGFPSPEHMSEEHPVKPEKGYEVGAYETRKSRLGKAGLALVRGPKTALLFGTTPHVGMAKVNEHSNESNARRRQVVTAESSAFLGGLAAGLSTLITHDSLGLAEDIKNVVTNEKVLGIATAVAIGWGIVGNYAARLKEKKAFKTEHTKEETVLDVQAA